MKDKLKDIISSPITQANLMIVGILILVGCLHSYQHYIIEQDIDGYVREYCIKDPQTCINFGNRYK